VLSLIALAPIWAGLLLMALWSMATTVIYIWTREHGCPDILEIRLKRAESDPGLSPRAVAASAVKVWFAGIHVVAFAKLAHPFVHTRRMRLPGRVLRVVLLAAGMTLFGVSTTEHLLRRAGFRGDRLVRFALIGPLVHIPFAFFAGHALFEWLMDLMLSYWR